MRQIYEYDPFFGFRFVPELKARLLHDGGGGYLLRTNPQGFRCRHAFEKPKRGGLRRVLLFGDSFTAGEGVSDGYRYGDLLEELVPDLEVYNFGMPATGTDQHYLIYRECAREIEHDLLIIAVFVENVRRVASRYRYFLDQAGRRVLYEKPYFSLVDGKLVLHCVPPRKRPVEESALSPAERGSIFSSARFPRLRAAYQRLRRQPGFERLVHQSGLQEVLQRLFRYRPLTEYDEPANPAVQTLRVLLAEWISGHHRPVMLMPIPLHHYVLGVSDPASYQRLFRDVTRAAGATYYDPLPDLRRHPIDTRRSFFYEADGHLTRAGQAALASCMAGSVRELLGGSAPA